MNRTPHHPRQQNRIIFQTMNLLEHHATNSTAALILATLINSQAAGSNARAFSYRIARRCCSLVGVSINLSVVASKQNWG